jgi:hypothetical protein
MHHVAKSRTIGVLANRRKEVNVNCHKVVRSAHNVAEVSRIACPFPAEAGENPRLEGFIPRVPPFDPVPKAQK